MGRLLAFCRKSPLFIGFRRSIKGAIFVLNFIRWIKRLFAKIKPLNDKALARIEFVKKQKDLRKRLSK
jgi:hypothetical protein